MLHTDFEPQYPENLNLRLNLYKDTKTIMLLQNKNSMSQEMNWFENSFLASKELWIALSEMMSISGNMIMGYKESKLSEERLIFAIEDYLIDKGEFIDIHTKKDSKDDVIDYPIVKEKYKHFKGGIYTVMCIAPHTETGELLVICQNELFGSFHARPLKVWNTKTTDNKKRFEICLD